MMCRNSLKKFCSLQVDKSEKDMDVDSPPTSVQSQISHRQSVLPEVEMFSYLLVIIFLIDQKQIEEVSCLSTLLTPFPCMDKLLNPMLTRRKISQVTVFWVKCRGPDVEALMTSTTYSNNVEFKYKDDLTLSFRVGGWLVCVVRYPLFIL